MRLDALQVGDTVLKYNPPAEAARPTAHWRLYCFRGKELLGEPYHLHRQVSSQQRLFWSPRNVVYSLTAHAERFLMQWLLRML